MQVSNQTIDELKFMESDYAIEVFDMLINGASKEECEKAWRKAKFKYYLATRKKKGGKQLPFFCPHHDAIIK